MTEIVRRKKGAHLNALPLLIPIPGLDCHIVAARQHDTCRRVHCKTSNIIRMGLERDDFLVRVIIEHAKLEVVRTGDEPIFARDELYTTNGDVGHFERLH